MIEKLLPETKDSRIERHFDKYRRQMLPDETMINPAPTAESPSAARQ